MNCRHGSSLSIWNRTRNERRQILFKVRWRTNTFTHRLAGLLSCGVRYSGVRVDEWMVRGTQQTNLESTRLDFWTGLDIAVCNDGGVRFAGPFKTTISNLSCKLVSVLKENNMALQQFRSYFTRCLGLTVIAFGLLGGTALHRSVEASGPVLGAKVGNGGYYSGYGGGRYGAYHPGHFNYSGYGDGPYGYGSGSAYEFPTNGGYGYGNGSYYDRSGVSHFRKPLYDNRYQRRGYGIYGSFDSGW